MHPHLSLVSGALSMLFVIPFEELSLDLSYSYEATNTFPFPLRIGIPFECVPSRLHRMVRIIVFLQYSPSRSPDHTIVSVLNWCSRFSTLLCVCSLINAGHSRRSRFARPWTTSFGFGLAINKSWRNRIIGLAIEVMWTLSKQRESMSAYVKWHFISNCCKSVERSVLLEYIFQIPKRKPQLKSRTKQHLPIVFP